MRMLAYGAEGACAGRHISQLQRPSPRPAGAKQPSTGGPKEPRKEQSQAFVPIHLVGSQITELFKVTFLSCFP